MALRGGPVDFCAVYHGGRDVCGQGCIGDGSVRGGGHFPGAGQAAGGQSGQHPEHGGVCEALYFVTSACLQLWLWLSLFPKSWKDSGFTRRLYSGYSACHFWRWDLTLWGQDILRP